MLGMDVLSIASITGGDRRDYGIATLTKLPIAGSREIWLPGGERARCALITRHTWHNRELAVVNTHLSVLFRDRPEQVAALVRELEGEPIIVAGDFNMTPLSPAYRALARTFTSATRFARTWPAPAAVFPIDHILVRGPITIVRGHTWTRGGATRASDHLPVIAELMLV
jgi:endonuclease/exonuclease/phosphatase family metal-dependent hydrolase